MARFGAEKVNERGFEVTGPRQSHEKLKMRKL